MSHSPAVPCLLPPRMTSSFRDYAQDPELEEISSPSVVQALFHQNQNFEISGGTFNLTVQRKAPEFENFRRIRLGDIVLGKDIGGVQRVYGRNVVRRVYRAKIYGWESPMTVTTYEGQEKDVNEVWDEYISLHMRLRHPNVLQLFGIMSAQGLYAAIYHDEYISWEQMKQMYSRTPTQQVYFEHFHGNEFKAHGPYIAFMKNLQYLGMRQCTYWFDRSGKMCIEDTPTLNAQFQTHSVEANMTIHSPKYILPPMEASGMIDSLDLKSYYRELIGLGLWWQVRTLPLARHSTIRPHGVVKDVAGDLQEVAYLQLNHTPAKKWSFQGGNVVYPGYFGTHMLLNGWTRCSEKFAEHSQLRDFSFKLQLCCGSPEAPQELFSPFAQANYITSHLGTECSSYSFIGTVYASYSFTSWQLPESLGEIFLFLPPSRGFFTPNLTRCCFTTEEHYWSFDPSGNDRLSPNEALNLGLPQASLEILVSQIYVDETLFKDLHTFHTMKGFNPDSQEIAKHLGLPLFYFGDEGDPPPSPLFDVSSDSIAPLHEGSDNEKDNEPSDGDRGPRGPFMEEDPESDDEQILYPRMASSI
ncbi:hypothetical protein R3P38DRAFT_2818279 [Favolaschia claudopus]|uniref:Protein kinase domain-containing protein n=1 Tax=Favolaschia claudopus TaxID=2862362 RepID=A0AAW0EF69_9AGAR